MKIVLPSYLLVRLENIEVPSREQIKGISWIELGVLFAGVPFCLTFLKSRHRIGTTFCEGYHPVQSIRVSGCRVCWVWSGTRRGRWRCVMRSSQTLDHSPHSTAAPPLSLYFLLFSCHFRFRYWLPPLLPSTRSATRRFLLFSLPLLILLYPIPNLQAG